MAEQNREGEVGARRMIDADESCIGDQVETLLTPVIRMGPPAHVGEKAGRMPEPVLVFSFFDPSCCKEMICPGAQLVPVMRRARPQEIKLARGRDERIGRSTPGVEAFVKQALAHAEGGNLYPVRLCPEDLLQHDSTVGEQGTPCLGHALDVLERPGVDPLHQLEEVEAVPRREAVSMHDMKRIAAGGHMQPGQRTPCAADRVEATAVQLAKLRRPRERFAHDALGLLKRPSGQVLQGKAAKLEGHALPDLCADNIDELQAAAAEIADHAVRTMKSRDDAECRQLCFARARQELDGVPARIPCGLKECTTIRGVTRRRSREHARVRHIESLAEHAKSGQGPQRSLDCVIIKPSRGRDVAAEPAQDLFVVDRGRRPRQAFIGDEAHRVRADIDDRNRAPDQRGARIGWLVLRSWVA